MPPSGTGKFGIKGGGAAEKMRQRLTKRESLGWGKLFVLDYL